MQGDLRLAVFSGKHNGRYFRFRSALLKDCRVDGLMITAALATRQGFTNFAELDDTVYLDTISRILNS